MREHSKSLYFSGSWHDTDRKLSLLVAKTFASRGFLVVGDDPHYRDHEHERELDYPARVAEILDDCCGIVVLWPKRDSPQTTSPYMFPEPLYAAKSGLPVFVLYTDGVTIDVDQSEGKTVLAFGGSGHSTEVLDVDRLESEGFSDLLVEKTFRIDLKKPASFVGPIRVLPDPAQYAKEEENIVVAVQRFSDSLPPARNPKFVFNIIPFAMQREHREIARVVLEQTGLPCFTAEDHRDSQDDVTDRWRKYLVESTLTIADLSTPRETCALEVGLALGKDKPLFIVSKRAVEDLPYGTHTRPVETYHSHSELRDAVRKFCRPYRRRIINIEIIEEEMGGDEESGLPEWYFRKVWFDLSKMLLTFSVLLSLGFSALLAALVHIVAPEQALAPILAGTLMAVFGITVSTFDPLQEMLEKWIAERIRLCLSAVLVFAVVAGIVLWQVL